MEKLTWNEVKEKYLQFHKIDKFKENMAIDVDFGYWLVNEFVIAKETETINYKPLQKCPKCDGQGTVSRPPYIPGDINTWTSSSSTFVCDVCNGAKVIPMI